MDLNHQARVKYARTLAGNAGLALVEEEIDQPRTSGRTIYVPRYKAVWNEGSKEYNYWWYAFLHEIRHNNHPDDFDLIRREKVNMQSRFGFIHNINLDHNIEVTGRGVYPGIDRMLTVGRAEFLEKQAIKSAAITDRDEKLDALWCFDTIVRSGWNDKIHITNKLIEGLSDEAAEWLDKLLPLEEEWRSEKGSEEVYQLTKKVADILELDDESEGGEQDSSPSSGKGEEGEEERDPEGEGIGGIVDYLDMLAHEHDDKGAVAKEPGEVTIDYSRWNTEGEWVPGEFMALAPTATPAAWVREGINAISGGEGMANEMRQYLQVATQSRYESGYDRGRLDGSRLWKHRVYGAYSDSGRHVFKQRTVEELLDTAVMILVDGSGSMCGEKYAHAAKAATLLNSTLEELQIECAIHSFTDGYRCKQFEHKNFDTTINTEELIDTFASASEEMGSNADGDNILYSAGLLLERREQKKILIVLSDGQPAASSGAGDIYGWTKRVIREIEEDGDIEIYGIGLLDSTVEELYSNNAVIEDAASLEECLIKLLQEHVLV